MTNAHKLTTHYMEEKVVKQMKVVKQNKICLTAVGIEISTLVKWSSWSSEFYKLF